MNAFANNVAAKDQALYKRFAIIYRLEYTLAVILMLQLVFTVADVSFLTAV